MKATTQQGDTRRHMIEGIVLYAPAGDRYFDNPSWLKRHHMDEVDRVVAALGYTPGGLLVDVGACNGVTAITAVKRGHFDQALAIEPDKTNYELLKKGVDGSSVAVETWPYAAASFVGLGRIDRAEKNAGGHMFFEDDEDGLVTAWTLDMIVGLREPTLVWADCEGSEADVLLGATDILKRHACPWYLEINPKSLAAHGHGDDFPDIVLASGFDWFADLGLGSMEGPGGRPKVPRHKERRPIAEFPEAYRDEWKNLKATNVLFGCE